VDVQYALLDGTAAAPMVPELVDLYAVVYAEPPYSEGPEQVHEFATKLPAELDQPGFAFTRASVDDRLVGAAYGWTMPPGRWWSNADTEPPQNILDASKLAVMEWIVHPHVRGCGIGARLIRMLLAERSESWAVLASDPRSAARAMYQRAGWQQVGKSALPWGTTMDLLALPLTQPEPS
jgi:GNAT superfamily N-acetyltransferase